MIYIPILRPQRHYSTCNNNYGSIGYRTGNMGSWEWYIGVAFNKTISGYQTNNLALTSSRIVSAVSYYVLLLFYLLYLSIYLSYISLNQLLSVPVLYV